MYKFMNITASFGGAHIHWTLKKIFPTVHGPKWILHFYKSHLNFAHVAKKIALL